MSTQRLIQIAALPLIAKNEPKCPSSGKDKQNVVYYIHTIKFCSAVRNKLLTHAYLDEPQR